jgi:tetratricopeptide (TPR) repeat protein
LGEFYRDQTNTKKIERVFKTGEPLSFMPYVIAQMALAGAHAAHIERIEPDRVKAYVEKAMEVFDSIERRGNDLAQEDWENYRFMVLAAGNQFLGLYALRKLTSFELAVYYFSRAIAIKNPKRSEGWKDPVNYLYRAEATQMLYAKAKAKYHGLTEEQKNGELGKVLLAQINSYLQQRIEDYARLLALVQSNRPEFGAYADFARDRLRELLKDDPNRDKTMQDLIKRFQAEFAA